MDEKRLDRVIAIHNCGIDVFPKADGRVEIPQFIVKAMCWEKERKIWITNENVGLCVYPCEKDGALGCSVSSGRRFRIPAGILKKTSFFQKNLVFVIERSRLVARPRIEKSEVKSEPNVKIKPSLIMLDVEKPLKFRPVGKPFRFYGAFRSSGEILVSGSQNYSFYLVPGIKNHGDKREIGFLLLGRLTFNQLSNKIISNGGDRELVFQHCKWEEGGFSIIRNPPSDDEYPLVLIDLVKKVCKDPGDFLKEYFDRDNAVWSMTPPSIISKQTINLKAN